MSSGSADDCIASAVTENLACRIKKTGQNVIGARTLLCRPHATRLLSSPPLYITPSSSHLTRHYGKFSSSGKVTASRIATGKDDVDLLGTTLSEKL
ncbi:hypothetical protein IG631_04438 [Alternaria alternata]|nr:hypothetical protein IG631_04438 [Alternaria alternata]